MSRTPTRRRELIFHAVVYVCVLAVIVRSDEGAISVDTLLRAAVAHVGILLGIGVAAFAALALLAIVVGGVGIVVFLGWAVLLLTGGIVLWPLTAVTMLAAFFMGPELAVLALTHDLTIESAPPGRAAMVHVEASGSRGLMHSRAYGDADALAQTAEWLRGRMEQRAALTARVKGALAALLERARANAL